MGTFIAAHILIVCELFDEFHLVDKTENSRFRKLAVFDRALIFQLPEDLGRGKARIGVLEETDLLAKSIVDLPTDTAVRPPGGKQPVKPGVFVGKMPFLDRAGRIVADLTVRSFDAFSRDVTVISPKGFIVFLCAGNEWCDGGLAHKGDRLTLVLVHKEPPCMIFLHHRRRSQECRVKLCGKCKKPRGSPAYLHELHGIKRKAVLDEGSDLPEEDRFRQEPLAPKVRISADDGFDIVFVDGGVPVTDSVPI